MYHNIKAILIGFLGADGEQRTTKNGASYTVLSVATKRSGRYIFPCWDPRGWFSNSEHRVTSETEPTEGRSRSGSK